jgi:hypothetical protein
LSDIILIDGSTNEAYKLDSSGNEAAIAALIAQGTSDDDVAEQLLRQVNMTRRVGLIPLDSEGEVSPNKQELIGDLTTGDLGVAIVTDGGEVIKLMPTKELKKRLDDYEAAGVMSFLQGTAANMDIHSFMYRDDKIFFDPQFRTPTIAKYYCITTFPKKSMTDPAFQQITPDKYNTLGEYYAALGEYMSIPLLGTVNNGQPSLTNPEHIGAFFDIIDGKPVSAVAIAPEVLKSGWPYKVQYYDEDRNPIGYPIVFNAVSALDPMIVTTKAYSYNVNGFSIVTERDVDGENATIMQGEDPYSITSQFFLDFVNGPSKNITPEMGEKLDIRFLQSDGSTVFPYDSVAKKYTVDTGAMEIGDSYYMEARYTILTKADVKVSPGVEVETTETTLTLIEKKKFTVVKDVFVKPLNLIAIPYRANGGIYKLRTFGLYADGSVIDVTGSLIEPGADTTISSDGTDNTHTFSLKEGHNAQMDMSINSKIDITGSTPFAFSNISSFREGGSIVSVPRFISGKKENGKFFNDTSKEHTFRSVPLSAQISGEIYFWLSNANITEFLGDAWDQVAGNVKEEDSTDYVETVPTHFTIRSVKNPNVKYVSSPIEIDTLKTSCYRLNASFAVPGSPDQPMAHDPLLIEFYHKDTDSNYKIVNCVPAYIIEADLGTSGKLDQAINAI